MASQYARDIAEIKETVAEIRVGLQHIARRQGEILAQQRESNALARHHAERLAALAQWQDDHEKEHAALRRGFVKGDFIGSAIAAFVGVLASFLRDTP